jgi:hypothetical protein
MMMSPLIYQLKSGKNKFWFGDISAGTDFVDRFINPKLFYYSQKQVLM